VGLHIGPCLRPGCSGRVAFANVEPGPIEGPPLAEPTLCPQCNLYHAREVGSGVVRAHWPEPAPAHPPTYVLHGRRVTHRSTSTG
jgi:hypothetical protein